MVWHFSELSSFIRKSVNIFTKVPRSVKSAEMILTFSCCPSISLIFVMGPINSGDLPTDWPKPWLTKPRFWEILSFLESGFPKLTKFSLLGSAPIERVLTLYFVVHSDMTLFRKELPKKILVLDRFCGLQYLAKRDFQENTITMCSFAAMWW